MQASTPRSRASGRWLYAGYLLAVICVALLGAGSFAASKMREQASDLFEISGTFLSFAADPDTGATLTSNGVSHYRSARLGLDFEVYTDSRGLRVRAAGEETPPEVDLLLVGDSPFFGWGLPYEQSVGPILQSRTGLRVASAAVPAASTLGAELQIEQHRALRPRWIAYDMIASHLERNACPCLNSATPFCDAQSYVAFDAAGAPFAHPPLESFLAPRDGTRRAFETIVRDRRALPSAYWGLRVAAGYLYRSWFHPCMHDAATQERAMRFALDRLIAASHAIGAELLVLYIPDLSGPSGEGDGIALQSLLGERAQEYASLDLSAAVNAHYAPRAPGESESPSLLLPRANYPSATGHALMARELCRALQTRAKLPPDACAPASSGGSE